MSNTAGHKESRRFLECIDDNFLFQAVEGTNEEGCSAGSPTHQKRNVKVKCSLGCSEHEMVKFMNPEEREQGEKQAYNPGLQERSLWLLQKSAWRDLWNKALEGQENRQE